MLGHVHRERIQRRLTIPIQSQHGQIPPPPRRRLSRLKSDVIRIVTATNNL